MVEGCGCSAYEGMTAGNGSHERHRQTRTKWGEWGYVQFSVDQSQRVEITPVLLN